MYKNTSSNNVFYSMNNNSNSNKKKSNISSSSHSNSFTLNIDTHKLDNSYIINTIESLRNVKNLTLTFNENINFFEDRIRNLIKNLKCKVKLILPRKLSVIEGNSFLCCENITSVEFSDSLKYIGVNAFSYCKNLNKVILPNTVEEIGYGVFFQCISLKKLILSESLKKIKNNCFTGSSNIKEVSLPNSLESLGHNAFRRCKISKLDLTKLNNKTIVTDLKDNTIKNYLIFGDNNFDNSTIKIKVRRNNVFVKKNNVKIDICDLNTKEDNKLIKSCLGISDNSDFIIKIVNGSASVKGVKNKKNSVKGKKNKVSKRSKISKKSNK